MTSWTVPKMWLDSTAYILGGAPSLLKENLSLIHNERVIGVNDAFRLGDWVDVCWFGDVRWFDWNKEELKKFKGLVACCCPRLADKNDWVKVLSRGKPQGIEPRPDFISWNKSSGGSAINLAIHFGVRRVVLLGYDMKPNEDGKDNWHDNHKVKNNTTLPYPRFLQSFPIIVRDAERMGVEIINTSMDSLIDEKYVRKMPLEEVGGMENRKQRDNHD